MRPPRNLGPLYVRHLKPYGANGNDIHTLRHTCITRMIEKGQSATVISAICGISLDMLRRRYDHSDARVVQVIGHAIMDDLLGVAA
ncbi:integrase [Bradyrhizobium sp. AZCC 2289]